MSFQIHALPAEAFLPLFAMTDAELALRRARRQVVTETPGTPCRVSLTDADIGDTVILLNYWHLDSESPYHASHAIYVKQDAKEAKPAPGEVPDMLRSRIMSVRLFDAQDMMIDADVLDGDRLSKALEAAFANESVAYVHLHNAKQGCFAASVTRAE